MVLESHFHLRAERIAVSSGAIKPTTETTRIMKSISLVSIYSMCICILILLSTSCCSSLGMATALNTSLVHSTSLTTDLPSILAKSVHDHHSHQHKCYVCLPPDKSSTEAQDILKLFQDSDNIPKIPDCDSFSSTSNRKAFEFNCPQDYRGCLLRIHGSNVSRSCVRFQLNDCKTANSVELCYCSGPLCNQDKLKLPHTPSDPINVKSTSSEERSAAQLTEEKEEAETRRIWQKGETDDEDLLEMQDDGSSGDGDGNGVNPPGVIDFHYTTTAKPTLVPNIRGDSSRFKTTPAPPPSRAASLTLSYLPISILCCTFLHFLLS